MDKKKPFLLIMAICYVISVFFSIAMAIGQGEKAQSIVPISNLPLQDHMLLFDVILPNILAPIFIILFPMIFVPLFLSVKNKIWYKFENTYVDLSANSFDVKKFGKRLVYLFLLTMGLSAMLLSSGIIRVSDFLTDHQKGYWIEDQGIDNPLYISDIFITIAYTVFPLAVGLWAIGWALEDCGLMHYDLPKQGEKRLYEIEPIFRKYQSVIKGYAGISAIVYFISAIAYYVIIRPGDISSLMGIFFRSIMLVFTIFPAYILYTLFIEHFFKERFTKDMKELRMITTDEINK